MLLHSLKGLSMGDRTGIAPSDEVKNIRRVSNSMHCSPRDSSPSLTGGIGNSSHQADDIDGAITGIRTPEHPRSNWFHAVEVSKVQSTDVHPVMTPKHAVEDRDDDHRRIVPLDSPEPSRACPDRPGPRPRTGRDVQLAGRDSALSTQPWTTMRRPSF